MPVLECELQRVLQPVVRHRQGLPANQGESELRRRPLCFGKKKRNTFRFTIRACNLHHPVSSAFPNRTIFSSPCSHPPSRPCWLTPPVVSATPALVRASTLLVPSPCRRRFISSSLQLEVGAGTIIDPEVAFPSPFAPPSPPPPHPSFLQTSRRRTAWLLCAAVWTAPLPRATPCSPPPP